jgi:hypothetical protein
MFTGEAADTIVTAFQLYSLDSCEPYSTKGVKVEMQKILYIDLD